MKTSKQIQPPVRKLWVAPAVTQLPKLTDLTLQTGGIPGECDPFDAASCF